MNKRLTYSAWGGAICFALIFNPLSAMAQAVPGVPTPAAFGEPADPGSSEGIEELARGPIHEAFAEQPSFDGAAGMTVAKKPPAPIEELPPEVAPEGENVVWIPGYWAWDDDRDDFIWISGVQRDVPPNQRWVPGYWHQVADGFQWVSGFWTREDRTEVEYQPAPPETLEAGPSSPAPSDDHFWVPGTWSYRDARYAWRPGFWTPNRVGWVWIPAYYRWSPLGYVSCGNYWDYEPMSRGVLYSPVYFRAGIYARPRFFWTPRTVVGFGNISFQFFTRPRYGHYYFGDYYGDVWRGRGIYANYNHRYHRSIYDPIFVYNRWDYRRNGRGDFVARSNDWHNYYRNNPQFRPPVTVAAQLRLQGRTDRPDYLRHTQSVARLDDIVNNKRREGFDYQKLNKVDIAKRDEWKREGERFRTAEIDRSKWEVSKAKEFARDGNERRGGSVDLKTGVKPGPKFTLPEVVKKADIDRRDGRGPDGRGPDTRGKPNIDRVDRGGDDRDNPRGRPFNPADGAKPSIKGPDAGDRKPPMRRGDDTPRVNDGNNKPIITPRPTDDKPPMRNPDVLKPRVDPPKVDRKPEPPKVDVKPINPPRIDRKPVDPPKVDRKLDPPKTEIKPINPPKFDKPVPRNEPKPAPRIEPRPMPRNEPKPAPRVQPPRGGNPGGDKKDDGPKGKRSALESQPAPRATFARTVEPRSVAPRAAEAPQTATRTREPSFAPRVGEDRPRTSVAPRAAAPRTVASRVEFKPQPQRVQQPVQRVQSAPVRSAPRVEVPRIQSAPARSAARAEAPRVSAPRATPRVETRSAPQRSGGNEQSGNDRGASRGGERGGRGR